MDAGEGPWSFPRSHREKKGGPSMAQINLANTQATHKKTIRQKIKKDFSMNKFLLLMAVPVVGWYILFHYVPMYGITIAFKDFSPMKGILGSPWAGMKHMMSFFNSYYAFRVIKNTVVINFYQLIFGFPAPIILALLLNELKNATFKRTVQTVSYLPHFISLVVMCGIIVDFTSIDGLINDIIVFFGGERIGFLLEERWFRTVYVGSGIWQNVGWGSILYLAALSNIDTQQYEAATIDGAGRWKQFLNVTLPGIAPTIIILLIMNMGKMMQEGAQKVILLYNPNVYETADIISSFVYRRGLVESNYSFGSAVGLFNSVINMTLLIIANSVSRKVNETSLW